MSKQLNIVPVNGRLYAGPGFRLEMRDTDNWGRLKKKRQYTVTRATLVRAIREAGLEQVKYIERETTLDQYIEHETTLDQDIAMYHALALVDAGPNTKLSADGRARQTNLWKRIQKRMGNI